MQEDEPWVETFILRPKLDTVDMHMSRDACLDIGIGSSISQCRNGDAARKASGAGADLIQGIGSDGRCHCGNLFSISRMLKTSASSVLASLRGSTYRSVRLASSLAAALLNSLFEHPAGYTPIFPTVQTGETPVCPQDFSTACYGFAGWVLFRQTPRVL
ncbi:MAG: hypothetical protein JW395_4028 [Nitrospira sp.]|nr:hypothetical protein [Nitrospira sp.]